MILLHAAPRARTVELTADDAEARAEATDAIAVLLGRPAAVLLTGSCSAALDAAASLAGIAPGDEVVVPAFTFPTSAVPWVARGARVRFADIDPLTANVSAATVGAVVTERTRAVTVMHYGGVAVDLAGIDAALGDRGIDVVEDAAQGLGAEHEGRALGTVGRFGALSFHRTKNLSSLDGGALVVRDADDVDAALVAVDKGTNRVRFEEGRVRAYEWMGLGAAARMPEAAVRYLLAELPDLAARQARRHEVVDRYEAELAPWALERGVGVPPPRAVHPSPAHLWYLVLPAAADRAPFVAHCAARGVQAARHYGSLPDSTFGRSIRHRDDRCPVAADLAERLVRIPLHPDLTEADVDRVIETVTGWTPAA